MLFNYNHALIMCVIVVTVILPSFFRSAIYASRLYLNQYHTTHPERLATNREGGPKTRGMYTCCLSERGLCARLLMHVFILGNVYIHPTANIDPTAVVSVS